jgi:hypothetical protein
MREITRCPYRTEGGQFKVMIGQGGGDWYSRKQAITLNTRDCLSMSEMAIF